MKQTKKYHNAVKEEKKFNDYVFRNQDPDNRSAREWVITMQQKHGINWINDSYTKYMIDLEDGIVTQNPKEKITI